MQEAERARAELVRAIEELGFPEEFGYVLAEELRGAHSMQRMTKYLRSAKPERPEEIADEMLAIVQMRDAWVERKVSEHAEATMTRFYNRDRGE